MTAKHTQGELTVQDPLGPDILSLVADGHRQVYDWKLVAQIAVSDEEGESINPVEATANAARLALCWNMHDELVEALRWTFTHLSRPQSRGKMNEHYFDRYHDVKALLEKLDGAK